MAELENAFSKKGTESLIVDGKLIFLPMNEDWQLVGKIIAYDASIGKVSFSKIWDQASSKETFYAEAKYFGRDGKPTESEVNTDSYAVFYRVGIGNNNFTSAPTAFQLDSAASLTKSSFVVFFF